jgi:uncharacterized SAM-binding protein YcdF (DUF218 family)
MTSPPNQTPPARRSLAARLRRCGQVLAIVVGVLGIAFVAAGFGFVGFLSQLRSTQSEAPANADGIVVLTGGSSRVSDAIELLAGGYGKRLLISGVHRANSLTDISRSLPDSESLLKCCVDLDHSAVNTRSNATGTRRWVQQQGFHSLIVVTSNYHMPRALAELARAMPGVDLIPYAVVDNNVHIEHWWTYPGSTKLLLSEYLKYLPALGRLWATELVRLVLTGGKTTPDDVPEP